MSYEISLLAEEDWRDIVNYTFDNHGEAQTRKYMDQLEKCISDLSIGEGFYKAMDGLIPDICLKHCEHHYIFGLMRDNKPMLVIAILHERMDLMVQLKRRFE